MRGLTNTMNGNGDSNSDSDSFSTSKAGCVALECRYNTLYASTRTHSNTKHTHATQSAVLIHRKSKIISYYIRQQAAPLRTYLYTSTEYTVHTHIHTSAPHTHITQFTLDYKHIHGRHTYRHVESVS